MACGVRQVVFTKEGIAALHVTSPSKGVQDLALQHLSLGGPTQEGGHLNGRHHDSIALPVSLQQLQHQKPHTALQLVQFGAPRRQRLCGVWQEQAQGVVPLLGGATPRKFLHRPGLQDWEREREREREETRAPPSLSTHSHRDRYTHLCRTVRCIFTCVWTNTSTHTRTHTHTGVDTGKGTYRDTDVSTDTHSRTGTRTHACMHTYIHRQRHTHVHACTDTDTLTRMTTHKDTYNSHTHTHTHTQQRVYMQPVRELRGVWIRGRGTDVVTCPSHIQGEGHSAGGGWDGARQGVLHLHLQRGTERRLCGRQRQRDDLHFHLGGWAAHRVAVCVVAVCNHTNWDVSE